MMMNFGDIAHAIQLALAPVFLLTGIAGLLNVMAGRLARIIDRGRNLTEQELPPHLNNPELLNKELGRLERRRHYASSAITACTCSALLVCMVVAVIFLQVLLQVEFRWVISALFTASTLTLIVGLGYFLREVHLATRTVRIQLITYTK
ncbi:MAG TPA: DUF2721 domain-containing protein [Cellvibrio sp.]|jgi:hypothetical protein|nr:DUF2721 domain-containing protein [Cellvibrio sp.]